MAQEDSAVFVSRLPISRSCIRIDSLRLDNC